MRIPEEKIKLILEKTSLVELASSYVDLSEKGDDFTGCCPFHHEKTPSFHLSNSKNLYHCFGCGKGGNAISFIKDIESLSFVDAIYFLADRAGVALEERGEDDEQSELRRNILKANKEYALKCHADLLATPSALSYANSRGLDGTLINHFCIGYASKDPLAGNVEFLKTAGIASEKGYSKFMGRLVFPIIDIHKNVLGFSARSIEDSSAAKYINSPNTLAYNKSYNLFGINYAKASPTDYFLLAEGQMDVIALHKAGFGSAVASCGTALTSGQAKLMKRYKTKVVICYDQDSSGKAAVDKAIEILRAESLDVRVAVWSGAKDPDEYIQKYGRDAFGKVLATSKDSNEYRYFELSKKFDLCVRAEKLAFTQEVVAMIAKIPSSVQREFYIGNVAQDTGISKESLAAELAKLQRVMRSTPANAKPADTVTPHKRSDKERELLEALANDFLLAKKHNITADTFENELYKRVFMELDQGRTLTELPTLPEFIEHSGELSDILIEKEICNIDTHIEQLLKMIKKEQRDRRIAQHAQADDFAAMQAILTKEK